jgi:ABC-type multidrug transport system ATPase subunit
MYLRLENIGKRYGLTWIFKGVNWELHSGDRAAVIGHNGSGKSTLLKIISGGLAQTKGTVAYRVNEQTLDADGIIGQLSYAAPYIELVEEMTLAEHLQFHFSFVPPIPGFSADDIVEVVGLTGQENKQVRHFSSGMKQRLRLALAFFSDTSLLLLDEPTANLDDNGVQMYLGLVNTHARGRTIIVGSNQVQEYSFCEKQLDITEFSL